MPETVVAGRYRLEELLGRGGMSEVWCATDLELDRRVALKLLAPGADTARFEREARAVASLSHPNVTRLYDHGEADDRPFIVLEYLPGGSLEERLRDTAPLPDDETQTVAVEIATGLAHAHSHGVVHRDLKPANILFDEEGHAKLADFGIARVAAAGGTITDVGSLLGTAAYISPEQAEGAIATPASDVYSFGVILYRMLTGRLPFEATAPLELVLQHRLAAPTPITSYRADAPAPLESTATAALAKNPSDRPPDGAALLAMLGPGRPESPDVAAPVLLPEEGTRVLPAHAGREETDSVPRRVPRPLVLAALLVLAFAGVGLSYELSRPAARSTPTPTATTPIHGTSTGKPHHGAPVTTASTTSHTTTRETTTRPSTANHTTAKHTTTRARPTTTAARTALPTSTAGSTTTPTSTEATTTDASSATTTAATASTTTTTP